jgi:hypothetical protein
MSMVQVPALRVFQTQGAGWITGVNGVTAGAFGTYLQGWRYGAISPLQWSLHVSADEK